MIVYVFLKNLVKIGLFVFFKELHIHGRENIPDRGPFIVAVNHPNTLMDIFLGVISLKQRMGFLAKAPLFHPPLMARFLTYLHAIPVYRQEDAKEGEGKLHNNFSSFRKCLSYLEKKGVIMIFPEGTSFSEMKLREVKTGVARIALEYARRHQFKEGIKILPVAINYSSPTRFRSEVLININQPIETKDYESIYQKSAVKAVKALTRELRIKLEEELIITDDKAQEKLYKSLRTIYQGKEQNNWEDSQKAQGIFRFQQALASSIRKLDKQNPKRYQKLQASVQSYVQKLEQLKLDKELFNATLPKLKNNFWLIVRTVYLLMSFPLCLFGLLTHIIPYWLPGQISPLITNEIEYWASLKLVIGIILFPIFYVIWAFLFHVFIAEHLWQSFLFFLCLPLAGLFTQHYLEQWQALAQLVKLRGVYSSNRKVFEDLRSAKAEILQLLKVEREVV